MELANEFEFQHFQPHLVLSKVVFDRICRTCLSVTDTTLIFEVTHGSIKLNEILKDVTSIQAKEDDNLPKCICLSCRNLLIQLYTFKQKVQRAELLLQTVLIEGNTIKEDVDLNTEPVVMPERIDEFTVKVEVDNVHIKEENLRLHYCNYCNKQFDSISDLQSHSCTVNEDEDLNKTVFPGVVVLPFDTKNFEKSVKKKKSKKGSIKEKQSTAHICKPCNKEFDTLSELKLHKKQVKHPTPRNHGCAECGKTFSHKNLIEHMRTHTKEKPFCCPLCSKQFSLKCNLRRHMMTHSGERPYKCDVCERGFARAGTLKHHKRTHTGETPYVCNYCGLSFGQSLKHKNHLRSHLANREEGNDKTVEEVFECNICNHSFTTKGGLKTHMLTHGEKTFLCSHCGKCFVSKSYLLSHSKTHTGVKPYSCTVCNKSFSDSSTLRSHVLIHTGEKPFVCKVCLKGFTQRTHLKNHMRTHTGEKPYSCMYCGKTFKLKGHLTVHIRMHTGETPYSCDKCDRGFSDYSGMAKHKRIHIKTEESF